MTLLLVVLCLTAPLARERGTTVNMDERKKSSAPAASGANPSISLANVVGHPSVCVGGGGGGERERDQPHLLQAQQGCVKILRFHCPNPLLY